MIVKVAPLWGKRGKPFVVVVATLNDLQGPSVSCFRRHERGVDISAVSVFRGIRVG